MIMGSLGHGAKQQLEPEELGARKRLVAEQNGAKEQLVAEENNGKEVILTSKIKLVSLEAIPQPLEVTFDPQDTLLRFQPFISPSFVLFATDPSSLITIHTKRLQGTGSSHRGSHHVVSEQLCIRNMSDKDKEGSSNAQNNKLLMEALTATLTTTLTASMAKMMDERFEVYQKRKEPELKAKPPENTLRSTRSSPQKISHTPKSNSMFYSDYQPTNALFKFSGKRNYIKWEKNMEEWFHDHHILREKRLAYAINQLTGDAYKRWVQEVDNRWYYKEPTITSWRDFKELLRNKYAPHTPNRAPQANAIVQGLAVHEKKPASRQYFVTKERSDRHKKSLAHKEQKETVKSNLMVEEKLKDELLNILNTYSKPKKAKCSFPSKSEKVKFDLPSEFVKNICDLSEKPDCVLENDQACGKLILCKPVQPSSIVSVSQVIEEESQEETQRSLPLDSHLEQPPHLVPEPVLMHFPYDYPRKHCKEFDLVKTEPNLFMLISAQDEKRFGFENVKELCVSKSVFEKMIPNFEAFTLEEFFKQKGFLFDEFHEFNSSLRISLCINAFELFRSKDEYALVKTFSELKHVLKNVSCESNPFIKLCNARVTDHVLKFSTSSIMHLFYPISVQKRTGVLVKHTYLGEVITSKSTFNVLHHDLRRAEGALNPLTIKEKPPDWHQPPYIRKESKDRSMSETRDFYKGNSVLMLGQGERLMCSIQMKENPPDTLFEQRSIPKVSVYVLKIPFIPYHTDMIRLSLSKEPNAGVKAVLKNMGSKTDLRSNPFQVGEDDMIMGSLGHGAKQQLEPEELGARKQLVAEQNGAKEQLVAEENNGKEVILTSLVLIHDQQMGMCLICTLFPLSLVLSQWVFQRKVFNEANDSHPNHPFDDQDRARIFRKSSKVLGIKSSPFYA
ncbi:hypothetical protein ISN44_As11g028720 [Arabidopsis suecica]|uniref:Uncharacterized protein n=1 Tax=Arabidopsis suecica TaxID=45249 RepID=A0A8T1ZD06_ARASU|nr:hypothetical protein ISN44_As11g028720 [Arabidopsis suecica]